MWAKVGVACRVERGMGRATPFLDNSGARYSAEMPTPYRPKPSRLWTEMKYEDTRRNNGLGIQEHKVYA